MRRLTIGFVLVATVVASLGVAAVGGSQSSAGLRLTVAALDPQQEVDFQLSLFAGSPTGDVVFLRETTPFTIEIDTAMVLATVRSVSAKRLEMRLSRGNGQLLTSITGTGGALGENVLGSGHRFAMDAVPPSNR